MSVGGHILFVLLHFLGLRWNQGWGSGFRVLTCEWYSKYYFISSLGNLQVLFFVSLIFWVRRSIDALDPENQPGSGSVKILTGSGSGALRLTENVWHQKYENKKEGLQNYLEFLFNSILNISHRSRYRPWIRNFTKTGSSSLGETITILIIGYIG